jgi:hypothetical protein
MIRHPPAKPLSRRFVFGYSGLSYDRALELRQALFTGRIGLRFPVVHDQKEREERIAVLNKILLETTP